MSQVRRTLQVRRTSPNYQLPITNYQTPMPHSFAQNQDVTCPHCQRQFTHTLWLIVDSEERPDLLEQIQAGSLHTAICPHCHTELGQADAPLLLYRPSQQPALLFSPAQQTSPEEDGEHFQGLLGMLQEQTRANWTQDWLQANVEAVPRQLLPLQLGGLPNEEAMRQMMAQMAQRVAELSHENPEMAAQLAQLLEADEETLGQMLAALQEEEEEEEYDEDEETSERERLLDQFIYQETWLGSYQFAREHPELLAEETIHYLEELLVLNADNENGVRILTEHLELLQACRTHGLAEAFAAKMGATVQQLEQAVSQPRDGGLNIPPELQPLINELAQLNRPHEMPRKIALLQQAIKRVPRPSNPPLWAALQMELANTLQKNPLGEQAQNIEQAIQLYEQALQVRIRAAMPTEWAQTTMGLALAYSNRIRGEQAQNIEQAIQLTEQALQVSTRAAMPTEWAQTTMNLATVYYSRIRGERAQNIEQAIQLYEQALQVMTRAAMPTEWAKTTMGLALAYSDRIRGERAHNIEQAIQLFEQALTLFTLATLPADHQQCQRNLGHLYFGEGQWAESLSAYRGAIAANKLLLGSASTREGQLAEVGEVSTLFARTAYALLQLGRFGEAMVQLDGGKARLLAQAVGQEEADVALLTAEEQAQFHQARATFRELQAGRQLPPDTLGRRPDSELSPLQETALNELNTTVARLRAAHPDFMPEGLRLAELLQLIPTGGALLAPVVTSHGGGVLVVPHGVSELTSAHYLPLPTLTDRQVRTWLIDTEEAHGWLWVYVEFLDKPSKQQNLETDLIGWNTILEAVKEQFLNPVQKKLADLHILHGAELLLMPQGGLGLLPLHQFWLDEYTVRYAPSGYAVQASLRRSAEGQRSGGAEGRLLAVVNPTGDLPFTPYEGEAVANLFGGEKTLYHEGAASRTPILEALGQHDYLHFSCHGNFGWGDSDQTGLMLAHGERITLRDILTHRLRPARLVTLSACETGMTDVLKAADEFLGLPAAFLQAGAIGVVGTLWAVNDLSTTLLMERFYTLHLRGMAPAQALREAQIWLRDVTAGELAKQLSAQRRALYQAGQSDNSHFDYVTAMADHFGEMAAAEQPYNHPYYWAAFTFSGV